MNSNDHEGRETLQDDSQVNLLAIPSEPQDEQETPSAMEDISSANVHEGGLSKESLCTEQEAIIHDNATNMWLSKQKAASKVSLRTEQEAIIHENDMNMWLSKQREQKEKFPGVTTSALSVSIGQATTKAKGEKSNAQAGQRIHFLPPTSACSNKTKREHMAQANGEKDAANKTNILEYAEDPPSQDNHLLAQRNASSTQAVEGTPPGPAQVPLSQSIPLPVDSSNPGAYRQGGSAPLFLESLSPRGLNEPATEPEEGSAVASNEPATELEEGLAVAHLVEEDHELPQATSVDSGHFPTRERKTAAIKGITLLAILCLAGIIALVVAYTKKSGTSSAMSKEEASTEPTAAINARPTLAPTDFEGYLLSLLPSATAETIQQQQDSAQALAFQWLLDDISSNPNWPEARIKQRFALVTLYFSTVGGEWAQRDKWLDHSAHECFWFNKESFARKDVLGSFFPGYLEDFYPPEEPAPDHCDVNGLYENLWLDANNLAGYIPMEIAMLTFLKTLSINSNPDLNGPIPSEIGQLSRLEGFSTYRLRNAGVIPSEIGLLSNLRALDLSNNSHRGQFPTEIWALTKLQLFNSRVSQISGTVPTEIGLMTNLSWIGFTSFSGSLPTEIGKLTKMHWMEMRETKLSGTMPSELGLLTNMAFLFVKMNNLTGTIHTELGRLRKVRVMAYMECGFSGTIPSELGQLTQIKESLVLEGNQLTGAVPSELGRLSNIYDISLSENQLSGVLPSQLGLLTSLGLLKLQNNLFETTVPSELSWLNKSLYGLHLEGNPFLTGVIPDGLCNINETCMETPINLCEEHGLLFDCSNNLCGCGCPCGE